MINHIKPISCFMIFLVSCAAAAGNKTWTKPVCNQDPFYTSKIMCITASPDFNTDHGIPTSENQTPPTLAYYRYRLEGMKNNFALESLKIIVGDDGGAPKIIGKKSLTDLRLRVDKNEIINIPKDNLSISVTSAGGAHIYIIDIYFNSFEGAPGRNMLIKQIMNGKRIYFKYLSNSNREAQFDINLSGFLEAHSMVNKFFSEN